MPLLPFTQCLGRNFNLRPNDDNTWPVDQIQAAVLMDLREELRAIRAEAQAQTKLLRSIRRAMPPRPRISLGGPRKAAR
jgi:hypothetical protein